MQRGEGPASPEAVFTFLFCFYATTTTAVAQPRRHQPRNVPASPRKSMHRQLPFSQQAEDRAIRAGTLQKPRAFQAGEEWPAQLRVTRVAVSHERHARQTGEGSNRWGKGGRK